MPARPAGPGGERWECPRGYSMQDATESHLAYFGLHEQPFAPTADPVYFYATREHRECLFRVWNSIDARHGIAVVLGHYGTGKTTLLRKLLTGMKADPGKYLTAVVGSPIPSWTSFALLESIVAQFGVQPEKQSFVAYMEALNQHLLRHRDKVVTLVIDDAQNLNKRGQLELLRLVQNLETHQHKLLNLLLFAQMEWTQVIQAAPNFAQRINLTYTLQPIQFDEARQFIEFRLQQAGATPEHGPHFEEPALRAIHAFAEGNPRVMVTLCRNALILAEQVRSRHMNTDLVLHTIDKTTVPAPERRARAAAAALQSGVTPAVVAPTAENPAEGAAAAEPAGHGAEAAPPVRTGRDTRTREQRASELLLRAARQRGESS